MADPKTRTACTAVMRGETVEGDPVVTLLSTPVIVEDLDPANMAALTGFMPDDLEGTGVAWARVVVLRGTAWTVAQMRGPKFLADLRRHAPGTIVHDLSSVGAVPAGWR